MQDNKNSRRNHRTDFWIKFAVVSVLIFFFVACIKINIDINTLKAEDLKLKEEVKKFSLEIELLRSEVENFDPTDKETIMKIAREELNLEVNNAMMYVNSQPN